jgi:hypothetical protein
MNALLLTLLLQSFFPIFDTTSNEYVGLSLVNPGEAEATYTVTVGNADGIGTGSGEVTLASGAQSSLLLSQILGNGQVPPVGWVRVNASAGAVEGVLSTGDGTGLAMAAPLTSAREMVLPDVRVDTGFKELGFTDTEVHIVAAPGIFPVTVQSQLIGLDGVVVSSMPMTVPSSGSTNFKISSVYGDLLPDNGVGGRTFNGYLRLTSNRNITAWQMVETPLFRRILAAQAIPDPTASGPVLAPFFAFGAGYQSTFNLVNTSAASLTLELTAEDGRNGTQAITVLRTLASGEALTEDVQTLFGIATVQTFPTPLVTGYIRVTASNNGAVPVNGSVTVSSDGQGGYQESSMSYPLGEATSNNWVLPFALSTGGFFSGYAITNPNTMLTVQTDVTIKIVASDGTVLATEVSLSPREQHTGVVPQGLGPGYVQITANMPIRVLGSIGTADSSLLEQVPAIAR